MSTEKSFVERRKHKRYTTKDGTYAVLRPPANKIGKIIDISLSGMAFTYFSTNGKTIEATGLDLLADEGLCLENIPYLMVDDCIIPNEQPFSQITMRRHCIQFNGISDEHANRLKSFIKKYGTTDFVDA
ncbi:MAG: PilZ domain-containing protein [Desulfobulbaceae bacterium]|uniref:PilZ domain-containing protein n=1 Tax=Candidatus Desulfobia pelagia TaxID=2841692 RepID=A0A8J6NDX8_9BACT|nr:PilZ domain-containing protein [Candidatus Desulfobia pelagia]